MLRLDVIYLLFCDQLFHDTAILSMQPQSIAMRCSEKMVVTLAVQSAASLATETLQFNVPCINRQAHSTITACNCHLNVSHNNIRASLWFMPCASCTLKFWDALQCMPQSLSYLPLRSGSSGCPCTCNYATDSTCQCRDLAETLNVTITKSAVYASYPLIYQQAFNYQPYEVGTLVLRVLSASY